MSDFKLDAFTRKGGELLEKTKKVFIEYQDLGITELNFKNLPDSMRAADGAVKLVFVGQYSSGKSSIIKMLSGIDTEIGAGIKTQEAHTYQWGDLEIIDTPGIHTELRPDHDEKTYNEINHAALLVFVVTNEGFDDRMGNHFRKLAIEQDRAKNMVLVVNKMDRTAQGNVPEQQEVIANDLLKVIEPYTPQELYLSFLDTESYFAGQEETDEEMKEIYSEQSGYQTFVEHLNAFVKSRGVLSKIQSPLETLKSAITNIIGDSDNLTSDADIEAFEEIFKRKKKALIMGKHSMDVEVKELAHTCADKIRSEGAKAANFIAPGVTREDVEGRLQSAQSASETYIKECENQIFSCLSNIVDEINGDISIIENSNFALSVQHHASKKLVGNLPDIPSDIDSNRADVGSSLKNSLRIGWTAKDVSAISKLPILNKLAPVDMVKNVGHFFGVKFRPWGAINVVKNLGTVLGILGALVSVYQYISNKEEEAEAKEKIREAKAGIQKEFNDMATTVEQSLIHASISKMNEVIAPTLKEAEEKLEEFQTKKERLKKLNRDLQAVLSEVNVLMGEVQLTVKE